jgi:hypothetical protein
MLLLVGWCGSAALPQDDPRQDNLHWPVPDERRSENGAQYCGAHPE